MDAEFEVVEAVSPEMLDEVFRIRYDVYCSERGFECSENGIETDEFDRNSRHLLLIDRQTREALGTARIVIPTPRSQSVSFPMQRVCDLTQHPDLPVATTGEISRFAISKHRRFNRRASQLMRLGLIRGLVRVSRDGGIMHWCAVMEPSLLRLLRATAIHFEPIGPLVEYHGIRQPAAAKLDDLLARMFRESPPLWDFVTDCGLYAEADVATLPLVA